MSLPSSQEERYAAILQPIRDMARNWDVDIAHYLEEYLEDLEKIVITFDDGITTMNFSEAALLIQGSANIYAKKVEYLHSLVYQALDLVTQKRKQKNTEGGEGDDGQGDNDIDGNADCQYLSLDDLGEGRDGGQASYLKELDASADKSVHPDPQILNSLIPLEDAEKGDVPYFNKKGEVIGDYCDFVVNTGYLAPDGSYLLEGEDEPLISMLTVQLQPLNIIPECLESSEGPLDQEDDPTDHCDYPLSEPPLCGDNGDGHQNVPPPTTGEVRELRPRRKRVSFATSVRKPTTDPWKLLDPFEKSSAVEKPIKKKMPCKIPPWLIDTTSKKRKKRLAAVKKELPPLHTVVQQMFCSRLSLPKNPLKVPDFPELEDMFKQEFKLRDQWKKEHIKLLKKEEQLEEESLLAEEDGEDHECVRDDDNLADGEDDEVPGIQVDADLFGNDFGNLTRMSVPELGGLQASLTDEVSMTYEDLVKKFVDEYLASAGEYAQITELSRRVSEWEDKVKPKLEQENKHDPFDIHKYGTFILEQLTRGEKRLFQELVKGKPEFEICRYSLATLLLANTYNVELSLEPDQTGSTMDRLYVTLLSKKRHFEELEEYRAPSLKDS